MTVPPNLGLITSLLGLEGGGGGTVAYVGVNYLVLRAKALSSFSMLHAVKREGLGDKVTYAIDIHVPQLHACTFI